MDVYILVLHLICIYLIRHIIVFDVIVTCLDIIMIFLKRIIQNRDTLITSYSIRSNICNVTKQWYVPNYKSLKVLNYEKEKIFKGVMLSREMKIHNLVS